MHIIFALLSLTCASINDAVFKLYTNKNDQIGFYLGVIGMIWTGIFLFVSGIPSLINMSRVTLWCGIISGIFSAVANLLFIVAMKKNDASVCSVIYRLNLALAAILAFAFLGEAITILKLLGIVAAIAAVLIFFSASKTIMDSGHTKTSGLWFVIVASILRACMGISYKYGLEIEAEKFPVLFLSGVMWIICGGLYHFIEKGGLGIRQAQNTLKYGCISGILVSGILLFLMLALEQGEASVVLPLAQLSFLGTAVIGVIKLKETLSGRKIAGLCLGLVCVFCMTIR
jgi:drug/metabolite transporter (DMT)-like permease